MNTLNDYKQKQLVEKLNRMKVSNLSKEEIMKSFDKDEIDLIKSQFGKLLDVIEKGKPATIGEIREWSGKKYKKQPNGKWLEVSEHGMTKKEHEDRSEQEKFSHRGSGYKQVIEAKENSKKHSEQASTLSDKEHSDEEVTGGEKKEWTNEHNPLTILSNLKPGKFTKDSDEYHALNHFKESDPYKISSLKHSVSYNEKDDVWNVGGKEEKK